MKTYNITKTKSPKYFYLIISMIGLITFNNCDEKKSSHVLRIGHVLDTNSPVHKAMIYLGERLDEYSKGSIKIKVYPSSQLGNERESLELLQVGSLDIAKVSSAVLENFVPEMGVYSLPYLFRDSDHLWKTLNSDIGKELLLGGEKFWLRGLCYYDAGFRSFFLKEKLVEKPEDLNGLKIRVMRSNLQIRTINLLGGNATPLAFSELYSALQQGVVDGAENNPPNFYQQHFYDHCKYFVLDEHSSPPDVLVISTHTWYKLSDEEKIWLEKAVDESVIYQRKLWDEMTNWVYDEVKKFGVEIIHPDKRNFLEAVQPIYNELDGTAIGEIAKKIQSIE